MTRRFLLHSSLAACATPLPGGLLVAVRLGLAGRLRRAAAAVGVALAAFLAGASISLSLPVPGLSTWVLVTALWGLGGIGMAVLESRLGVAPRPSEPRSVRPVAEVWSWIGATVVAGLPWAFLLAPLTSKWGWLLFTKPSMVRRVILVLVVVFVPLGALVGFVRARLLKRPYRIDAPVIFPAAVPAVFLALLLAAVVVEWLITAVWGIERSWEPTAWWFEIAYILAFIVAPTIALAVHLSEATGLRDALLRWAAIAAIAFVWVVAVDLADPYFGAAWHAAKAEERAAEGDPGAAAEHWAWVLDRSPTGTVARQAIRVGARDALLAGRLDRARALLARVAGDLATTYDVEELEALATRIGAPGGSLGPVSQVELAAVRSEEYLDRSWSALLTAVASVRPGSSETDLKRMLQTISPSLDETLLPDLTLMHSLEVTAGLFDLTAYAVAPGRFAAVLDRGVPVLFRARSAHWKVLWWVAPGADAAIWLDYALWDADDRELNEPQRLRTSAEEVDPPGRLRLARLSRLGPLSLIEAQMGRDAGWAVALVPSEEVAAWDRLLPGGRPDAERLTLISNLRRALDNRAARYVRSRISHLPDTAAKREILALLALDPGIEPTLDDTERRAARAAAGELLTDSGLATASPWFLTRLRDVGRIDRTLDCRWQRAILESLQEVVVDPQSVRRRRLALAVRDERHADAAVLGREVVRGEDSDDETVLEALELLASMPGAGAHPQSRKAIEDLSARLGPLVSTSADMLVPRKSRAAYWAAKATLSERPGERVRRWRRAIVLDPNRWAYRRNLADALEADGQSAPAGRQRRVVADSLPAPRCPAGGSPTAAPEGRS